MLIFTEGKMAISIAHMDPETLPCYVFCGISQMGIKPVLEPV